MQEDYLRLACHLKTVFLYSLKIKMVLEQIISHLTSTLSQNLF